MRLGLLLTAVLPIVLAACGEDSTEDGVGGVMTASEARALNDAAEMLDKRPASPAAIDVNAAE